MLVPSPASVAPRSPGSRDMRWQEGVPGWLCPTASQNRTSPGPDAAVGTSERCRGQEREGCRIGTAPPERLPGDTRDICVRISTLCLFTAPRPARGWVRLRCQGAAMHTKQRWEVISGEELQIFPGTQHCHGTLAPSSPRLLSVGLLHQSTRGAAGTSPSCGSPLTQGSCSVGIGVERNVGTNAMFPAAGVLEKSQLRPVPPGCGCHSPQQPALHGPQPTHPTAARKSHHH